MRMPEIETERLYLREISLQDAKDIYEYIKREKMKIPMIAKAYHHTLPVRKVIHAIRGDWKG